MGLHQNQMAWMKKNRIMSRERALAEGRAAEEKREAGPRELGLQKLEAKEDVDMEVRHGSQEHPKHIPI